MSKLACHVQKFKASDVRGIQIHNQRESENSKNTDIDHTKTNLNYDLHNDQSINYNHRVKEIIADGYAGEKQIRKDAVVMTGILVTAEKDFFDKLSDEEQKDFFKESYEYLKEEYGENNIVSAIVHMDEKTPHLHVSVVPLTQQGKLSAKEIFDRNGLRKLQDKLPERLKRFNIERGKPSDKKHVTTHEFKRQKFKQIEQDNKLFEKYAPCFDKIEEAYNSAKKNLLGGKYNIELDKLNYLRGSARQGLGKNYNTDHLEQKVQMLESSIKYYQTKTKEYPAIEKKIQAIEKVLNGNPDLKRQFEKEIQLQKQTQMQKSAKKPKFFK